MKFKSLLLLLSIFTAQAFPATIDVGVGNATMLQGYGIANTAPTNAYVLTWNASTSSWTPAPTGGGGGTVTSVAMTVPAFLSVSGSPITGAGTLAVSLSGTALPIANGGTGQTTAAAALTALGGAKTDLSNLITTNINANLILNTGSAATVKTQDAAAVTKALTITTGDASGANNSGALTLSTGSSGSATRGDITLDGHNLSAFGHTLDVEMDSMTFLSQGAIHHEAIGLVDFTGLSNFRVESIATFSGLVTGEGGFNSNGFVISSVGTPVASTDAANKSYVDGSIAVKPAVTVVATSNLTLSGAQTIDGQLTVAGTSIVLATAQSTGSQNGPWVVQAGAWTRPTWYASGNTTQAFQFITTMSRLGTVYQGSTWRMTTSGTITIDTTATTWSVTPIAANPTTTNGIFNNTAVKTANYTIASTDVYVYADTTGGAFNLTLPDPSTVTNKTFWIKDTGGAFGTNNLTVVRFGSESIEGLASSLVLSANWGMYGIRSNGTNWFKVGTNSNRATKTFTSSGSLVVPAGVTQMIVFERAGSGAGSSGSGGGGGSTSAGARGGGGGTAGMPAITRSKMVTVTPGSTVTVTVGAGGAGQAGGAGATPINAAGASGTNGTAGPDGGNTTFGSLFTQIGTQGGFAPVAGGISTTGVGAGGGRGSETSSVAGGNGALTNAAGATASTAGNSLSGLAGLRAVGGAAGGATNSGGGGGGASGISGADGDCQSNASAVGGDGGAAGATGGTGGAGATQTGAGCGGAGGGGGGGGGLLVGGSLGGTGGASSSGVNGYATAVWNE